MVSLMMKCVQRILKEHFHAASLEGMGLGDYNCGVIAAGALLKYLYETQKTSLAHITHITAICDREIYDYWTALPEETWNCVRRCVKNKKEALFYGCWIRRKRLWAPECCEVILNSR